MCGAMTGTYSTFRATVKGQWSCSVLDPAGRQVARFGEHPPHHRLEHVDRLGRVVRIERCLVVALAELRRELVVRVVAPAVAAVALFLAQVAEVVQLEHGM